MVDLDYLKYTLNYSDETLVEKIMQNLLDLFLLI